MIVKQQSFAKKEDFLFYIFCKGLFAILVWIVRRVGVWISPDMCTAARSQASHKCFSLIKVSFPGVCG